LLATPAETSAPPAIWSLVVLLFAANTINIAADLGATADALKLVVGGSSVRCVMAFGLVSVLVQVRSSVLASLRLIVVEIGACYVA
jgi:hypothetical protein